MDSSVQLTEYAGLVNHVFSKLSRALKPQLGDGPSEAADRTDKVPGSAPAERALNLRFALGGDTVTYLNNGVALLAAGTQYGAIDVSGLSGSDALTGVKDAVYSELRRRERLDLHNAPRELDDVRSLVVWLLCIPEVARAYAYATAQGYAPYERAASESEGEADPSERPESLIDAVKRVGAVSDDSDEDAPAQPRVDAVYAMVKAQSIQGLRETIRILLQFLNPFHGPRHVIESMLRDIESTDHALEPTQGEHVERATSFGIAAPNSDLVSRYAMLQREMETAAQPTHTDAWVDRCIADATPISKALPISTWVQMAGLVGEVGPGEKRGRNQPFPYNLSLFDKLSLPRAKYEGTWDPEETGLEPFLQLGAILGVCLIGCNAGETGVALTMPLRWIPQGQLARDQSRAAVLEHVVQNMRVWGDSVGQGHELIAASAKLLQIEHLQRIRTDASEIARGINDVPNLVTPNAQRHTGGMLLGAPFLRPAGTTAPIEYEGVPMRDAILSQLDDAKRTTFDATESQAESHRAALQAAGKWRFARIIPIGEDVVFARAHESAPSPGPVLGRKRQVRGHRLPVQAELLSADSLMGCELSLEPRFEPHTLRLVNTSAWQGTCSMAPACATSSRVARPWRHRALPCHLRHRGPRLRGPRCGARC